MKLSVIVVTEQFFEKLEKPITKTIHRISAIDLYSETTRSKQIIKENYRVAFKSSPA